jgi:hypothetical protein
MILFITPSPVHVYLSDDEIRYFAKHFMTNDGKARRWQDLSTNEIEWLTARMMDAISSTKYAINASAFEFEEDE